MASPLAYLVLFSWPVVVIFLFKRLSLQEALAWSIVAGFLLLPNFQAFDLPLVPPFNKQLVINLSAAVMCAATANAMLRRRKLATPRSATHGLRQRVEAETGEEFIVRRGTILFWSLLAIMFSSTLITVIENQEPLIRGLRAISGLRFHDTMSISLSLLITITPFLLGRRFLRTSESHLTLLKVLAIACLVYTIPALWEIRMSPQLHRQFYGYYSHMFLQSVRGDGFRPIVFTGHGLMLANMLALSSIAAMAIWKEKLKSGASAKWLIASVYLFAVLILCKSLGALIILVAILPLVFMFSTGIQLFVAAVISGIILTYPLVRGADLVPTQKILEVAASIDPKRAVSLDFRFHNEDKLLAHANRKPLAGWGTWGRNRVYNDDGTDVSIPDGYWVIVVGTSGWLGYIAQFGLLGISVVLLALNRRRLQLTAATSGLAILHAGAMIDLIPNATISPFTWLVAGALMGRYQTAEATVRQTNIRQDPARRQDDEVTSENEIPARRRGVPTLDRPLHQRRPREG